MSAISEFITQTNFKTNIADGHYSGITSRVSVSSNNFGKFAVLYMTSNGYELAGASTDTKTPGTVMALESGTGAEILVLKSGYVRNSSWSFTTGQPVYLSTTDGDITQTKPDATNNAVQYLGEAYSSDILNFKPDATVITLS